MSHISCILQFFHFSSCMWCEMMHCCLTDVIWGILLCHSSIILHIIWPLQIGFQHHIISLSSCTNNQPPCGPFFHSCYILWWINVLCYSCFCFLYSHLTINLTLNGHTCHTCCMCPWRNCSCIFSFLQILVIEISLRSLDSLFSCFHLIMSSKANKFISFWSFYAIFEMLTFQETLTG